MKGEKRPRNREERRKERKRKEEKKEKENRGERQKLRRKGVMRREERKAWERRELRATLGGGPGRGASAEMGLLVFYETCPFFFPFLKVLLGIFMFIYFNLGLASWKMHEE